MLALGTRIKTGFASKKSIKVWETLHSSMRYLICPCSVKNEIGTIQQHFKFEREDAYIISFTLTSTKTPALTVFVESELRNLN